MSKQTNLFIPALLKNFRLPIESSVLPYITIIQTEHSPTLFDSKFGGYPYIPLSSTYPKDEDGNNMLLLAQINLADVPLLDLFPKDGLLQFFISPNLYEYYKENIATVEQANLFFVRYFPYLLSKEKIVTDFSNIELDYNASFPIKKELHLIFRLENEPVSATDYRIYNYINQQALEATADEDGRTYQDIYLEYYLGAAHKMGGYPYFLEEDIRLHSIPHRLYDTLLLQIISDDEDGIMWGNSGILKFFIHKKNLKQLDFSNVYLHVEDY